MFAVFLLRFRAMVWRRILKRFGHRVPVGAGDADLVHLRAGPLPARRHLAGRRPHLPRQTLRRARHHCSASQVLELFIFLLRQHARRRRVPVWFGIKKMDGLAEAWLYVAMALVPVLVCCCTRAFFYGS